MYSTRPLHLPTSRKPKYQYITRLDLDNSGSARKLSTRRVVGNRGVTYEVAVAPRAQLYSERASGSELLKYVTIGIRLAGRPYPHPCCDTNGQLHLHLDTNVYPRPHSRPGFYSSPRLFYSQIPLLRLKVGATPRGIFRGGHTPLQAKFLR